MKKNNQGSFFPFKGSFLGAITQTGLEKDLNVVRRPNQVVVEPRKRKTIDGREEKTMDRQSVCAKVTPVWTEETGN